MVRLDGWAIILVQKWPVEGALSVKVTNNVNICSLVGVSLIYQVNFSKAGEKGRSDFAPPEHFTKRLFLNFDYKVKQQFS